MVNSYTHTLNAEQVILGTVMSQGANKEDSKASLVNFLENYKKAVPHGDAKISLNEGKTALVWEHKNKILRTMSFDKLDLLTLDGVEMGETPEDILKYAIKGHNLIRRYTIVGKGKILDDNSSYNPYAGCSIDGSEKKYRQYMANNAKYGY